MASNREEKLQMRQRGAASRKVKEVDFGFSFGLGPLGSETEGPAHPSSQPTAAVAEPPTSRPTSSAPENTQPPPLPPSNGLSASSSQTGQQRPGSARSTRRHRSSTFDIPSDEEPEPRRTSKRRRIEPPSDALAVRTEEDDIQMESRSSLPLQNGNHVNATKSDFGESVDRPLEDDNQRKKQSVEGIPGTTVAPEPVAPDREQGKPEDQQLEVHGENENGSVDQGVPQLDNPEPPASANGSKPATKTDDRPSPKNAATNGTRKRPESRIDDYPSPESTSPVTNTNGKHRISASTDDYVSPKNGATAAMDTADMHKQPQPVEPSQGAPLHDNSEKQVSKPQRGKRRRGRPSTSPQTQPTKSKEPEEDQGLSADTVSAQPQDRPAAEDTATAEVETSQTTDIAKETPHESSEARISEQQRGKRPRGRPSTSAQTTPDKNGEREESQAAPADSVSAQPRNRRRRGKNAKDRAPPAEVSGANEEPNGKLNAKANANDTPNHDENTQTSQQQKQPKKTKNQKSARRQGGRARGQTQSVRDEPQAEQEPEQDNQQEPTAEPVAVESRRGQRTKKGGSSTAVPESEQAPREEAGEEASRPARKTRSRGETVPVTVHRLANAALLMGDGASSAGEESADELSTDRAIKLPNRGGVNPADVLSQVCRETLEKTLTTLKNGIANETNSARRSEYVRKTKAVEGYWTELEGRLLELSETHDNNYMLGVQTKRAKKEVMDLRGRFYHIRKERQEVAAQMDAVRRQHAEDLSARATRSTINNSLHSLELALDRSQNRSTSEGGNRDHTESSVTDGLEFMLRTVADGVSSTAPGARGGLLNTIKAFNAQLETTAKDLGC